MNCFLLALAAGTALARKYMAVFARRPQKSGRNNGVAVRGGFTVVIE